MRHGTTGFVPPARTRLYHLRGFERFVNGRASNMSGGKPLEGTASDQLSFVEIWSLSGFTTSGLRSGDYVTKDQITSRLTCIVWVLPYLTSRVHSFVAEY